MRYILIRWMAMSYLGMGIFIAVMWKDFVEAQKSKWFLCWLFSPITFIVLFFYACGYTLTRIFTWFAKP